MNLDLSLASLVRASSGALMVAFGAYLLTLRPATTGSRALGFYHLLLGPVFVMNNLFRADLSALARIFLAEVPLFLAAAAALLVAAWSESRRDAPSRAGLVVGTLLLTAANLMAVWLVPTDIAASWASPDDAPEVRAALNGAYAYSRAASIVTSGAALALVIVLAGRFRRTPDQAERRRLALLAAALALWPVLDGWLSLLAEPATRAGGWLVASVSVFAAAAWALAARGPASGAARNVSLAIVAAGTAGAVLAVPGDDFGLLGVARLTGVALLAYAIFRHDLLGTAFTPRTVRRGTLATGALAALFIVAQIAQEFFAAEYGLLMGGVVAGALLFAANPIQRAMERMGEGEATRRLVPEASARGDAGEREAAYRAAVRLALRDRELTREEERHLLRLARHAGIDPARALDIHDEVEREPREA